MEIVKEGRSRSARIEGNGCSGGRRPRPFCQTKITDWYTSPEVMSGLANQKIGHAACIIWHFRAPFNLDHIAVGVCLASQGLLWLKLISGGSN